VERIRQRGVRSVYLIPNGADVELFRPASQGERSGMRRKLGLREDDFVIVFAGRIGWYYRIDMVIRALDTLINKQKLRRIRFLLLGPGERVQEYRDLCRELGLKEKVLFLGERRRDKVARILPCCDLGVIPLDDDPIWLSVYTTKIFEYCASGLPVIVSVTKGSDLEKLVEENKIGFAAEPTKPEKFAEAILEAYEHKDRLEEMRADARKLAVEKFNRRKTAEKLAEILERS
jgi:glycosyltransferase involved in cell wall biosynthesis